VELSTVFSKKTLLPRLRGFLLKQQLLVFIGVVIYAFFVALKMEAPFVVMMVVVLSVGNVLGPVMGFCIPICNRRRFPWNWVTFIPILAAASLLSALASVVLIRWMMPISQPFWDFFRVIAPSSGSLAWPPESSVTWSTKFRKNCRRKTGSSSRLSNEEPPLFSSRSRNSTEHAIFSRI